MTQFFSIFFLTFSLAITALANNKAPLTIKNGQAILSPQLSQLVRARHPDFTMLSNANFTKAVQENAKNHPMAFLGDFNGDRKKDAAFYGYSKKHKHFYIYATISTKNNKMKLHQIAAYKFEPHTTFNNFDVYITLGKASKIKAAKRDTLQIETYSQDLMSVEAYYYSLKSKAFKAFLGKMD